MVLGAGFQGENRFPAAPRALFGMSWVGWAVLSYIVEMDDDFWKTQVTSVIVGASG